MPPEPNTDPVSDADSPRFSAPRLTSRRPSPTRGARKAPIEFLRPNPRNPRKRFDDAELDELAASIKERGVIQPVLVRAIPRVADAYEIIAGERRWRAAQRAGLHDIPIIVIEAGDREALEIAIIENVQRADLNALEEAAGYAQLGADYGYSHADIARVVGKSRSHIANTLRLVNLPEHTRGCWPTGQISAGHARALLAVAHPDAVADRIVAEGLTVRDVERLGENSGAAARTRTKAPRAADADTLALQGEAQPRARRQGHDPACRRERRHPHRLPQFRAARRLLPPPLPARGEVVLIRRFAPPSPGGRRDAPLSIRHRRPRSQPGDHPAIPWTRGSSPRVTILEGDSA